MENSEPLTPSAASDGLGQAKAAFDFCKGFAAFILLALFLLMPVAALALSYILKWPAAYLLHDLFIPAGSLLAAFAALSLIFAAAGARFSDFIRRIRSHTYAVFFTLLLAWALVSTLLAADRKTALFGVPFRYNGYLTWLIYTSAGFLCSCIKSAPKAERYRSRLLNIFIGVSFVMCLVMMGQNYGVRFVTELNGSRNQSVLLNPNHFGYILALSIPCVGGRLIAQKRPMPAMLLGLLYVFECRTLMLNGSFGSELAVFAALLLMAPVYRLTLACGKKPWRAALPLAIFTAVYLLSGSLGEGRGGSDAASLLSDAASIIESSVSGGESLKTPLYNSDRLELWKAAVSYAAQKPVFGWGPDSLGPLYKGDGFSNTAAHNEYLQLAAELGFPALFLYLAGLSAFFLRIAVKLRKAVSLSESGLSPTSITAAGAALSYLISAFFGVSLFYSAQYFFILLALSSPD